MQHITQQTEFDCGFAVAAMLCNVSYDNACEWDADPDAERGINGEEMADLLWDITTEHSPELEDTHVAPRFVGTLSQPCPATGLITASVEEFAKAGLDDGAGVALLICRPSGEHGGHWVALKGQAVYDPESETAVLVDDYAHSHWRVCGYVRPTPQLKGNGKGRRAKK